MKCECAFSTCLLVASYSAIFFVKFIRPYCKGVFFFFAVLSISLFAVFHFPFVVSSAHFTDCIAWTSTWLRLLLCVSGCFKLIQLSFENVTLLSEISVLFSRVSHSGMYRNCRADEWTTDHSTSLWLQGLQWHRCQIGVMFSMLKFLCSLPLCNALPFFVCL